MICQEEKLIFGFAPDGARSRCLVINPPFPRGACALPSGSPHLENLPATAFLLHFCWRQIAPCLTHGAVRSLITENVSLQKMFYAVDLPKRRRCQQGTGFRMGGLCFQNLIKIISGSLRSVARSYPS